MSAISHKARLFLIICLVTALVAGCTPVTTTSMTTTASSGSTQATTTATESVTTRTSPSTTQSSTPPTSAQPGSFSMEIVPQQLNGFAIAGQRCCFLVTLNGVSQPLADPARISATVEGATVAVRNGNMQDGPVAEIIVRPEVASVGRTVTVTFIGQLGSATGQKQVSFDVIEGEDDRQAYASELQARFIAYLAAKRPDLGITAQTRWTGTMVSPQWLVVSHYLFFSDEWEMHVAWHIMIPPSDWARIDLRRRYQEQKPSQAFEISSVDGKTAPIPIEVPAAVWR